MYAWALQLYQTLPNFTGHHAILCYSFLCLANKVGQFMRTGRSDRTPTSYAMLSRALQMAKPAMQQLEGDNKSFNGAMHYLPCVFDTVQHQQQVKGCVPHHSMESDHYKKERAEIMQSLQVLTTHSYPSPISLDNKLHNLVLPPELYDSLFLP